MTVARRNVRHPREGVVPAPASAATRLKVEHVSTSRLQPWPANPRIMPAPELAKLVRSIKEFGLVEPLVVRRSDFLVLGGHQRLEAAKSLGMTTVPVVFVEVSDAQAKTLNLALNRVSGEWDLPKLGVLLDELQSLPDLDVTLTGFDLPEIDDLLAGLEREAAPSPREETFFEAAEALQHQAEQAPTRVSRGDLWLLGRHRLLCDDSLLPGHLEKVCGDRPVDAVVTDPPYGLGFLSTQPAPGRRKRRIANDEVDGFESFLDRALPAVKAQMKKGAILLWFTAGGGPSDALAKALLAVTRHFTMLNLLVWDKMDPGLGWRWRRSWEGIIEASVGKPRVWHGGTDRRNVLRHPRIISQASDHPTVKPLPLLEELIRCSVPAKGLVLDPFLGSGSTLIAAERTGRTCFAVELEPHYCDITVARWEALSGQRATKVE